MREKGRVGDGGVEAKAGRSSERKREGEPRGKEGEGGGANPDCGS